MIKKNTNSIKTVNECDEKTHCLAERVKFKIIIAQLVNTFVLVSKHSGFP